MAEGHGGYRKPAHPAPVSGPGKYSKRTDGKPGQVLSAAPDQPYGAMKQELNAQRTQPMAAADPMPPAAPVGNADASAAPSAPSYQGGAFGAPSARPNEPVTAGAPAGPGPGPEALNFAPTGAAPTGQMTALLSQLAVTDRTGTLAKLLASAQQRGV